MYAAVAALINSRFHKLLSPESIFGPDRRFSPDASLEVLLEMKQRSLVTDLSLVLPAPYHSMHRPKHCVVGPGNPFPCVRPPFGRQAPVL